MNTPSSSSGSRTRLVLATAAFALAGCTDTVAVERDAAIALRDAPASPPDAATTTTPDSQVAVDVAVTADGSPGSDAFTTDTSIPPVDSQVVRDAGLSVTVWSHRYGETSDQDCLSLAVDASGNVVLGTYIGGTVDFGNGPLSGFDRVAIAKLDPGGTSLWSHIYPNGGHQYANGIAVAPTGAIVTAGSFEGTLNFGGTALVSAGADDIFTAGFTASGTTSWSHSYGDPSVFQRALDVAIDSDGNAVFVGHLNGPTNLGGATLTGDNVDLFVAKLDASGNHAWSHSWGDGAMQVAYGVAVDPNGFIAVSGRLDGTVNLGGGAFPTGSSIFLMRLTPAGAYSFARAFRTSETAAKRNRVAVDGAGNVYLAGSFQGTVDLGDGVLASRGGFDAFVAKYDPAGTLLWHREYGAAGNQEITDIAVDAAGDVALTGTFDGTVDFGGGALASLGGDTFVGGDLFVVKLDATGAHRFSARYGDAGAQRGNTIAIAPGGDLVVAGTFNGTIDFGNAPLVSAGGTDIFVARIREAH